MLWWWSEYCWSLPKQVLGLALSWWVVLSPNDTWLWGWSTVALGFVTMSLELVSHVCRVLSTIDLEFCQQLLWSFLSHGFEVLSALALRICQSRFWAFVNHCSSICQSWLWNLSAMMGSSAVAIELVHHGSGVNLLWLWSWPTIAKGFVNHSSGICHFGFSVDQLWPLGSPTLDWSAMVLEMINYGYIDDN